MNSKHDALLDILKDITLESLSEWQYSYTSVFWTSPWSIDGESILNMQEIEDPFNNFYVRSSTLSKHLVSKLTKGGFTSFIKEFEHMIQKGHGVTLFSLSLTNSFPELPTRFLIILVASGICFNRAERRRIISKFDQVEFGNVWALSATTI